MKYFIIGLLYLLSDNLCALPLGFGYNQKRAKFQESASAHFRHYFDSRIAREGAMVLAAMEAAKPNLERWMGVSRKNILPVISSGVSLNASFANFITDVIELQTQGQGERDLYWHELAHNIMYQSLQNFLGPAGTVLHLPWMPAWFLEGLAEAMSVSLNSTWQAGIERFYALNGDWPSYDRLHNLYTNDSFNTVSYAISGAFVAWILRRAKPGFLPRFLKNFYDYTMPWYYPQTLVPSLMPLDRALRDEFALTGFELYEKYKEEATVYWQGQNADIFVAEKKKNENSYSSTFFVHALDSHLFGAFKDEEDLFLAPLKKSEGGWFSNFANPLSKLPSSSYGGYVLDAQNFVSLQEERDEEDEGIYTKINFFSKDLTNFHSLKRPGTASTFFKYEDNIYWFEQVYTKTSLCFTAIASADVVCPISAEQPRSLKFVGSFADKLWFSLRKQSLKGDNFSLISFDKKLNKTQIVIENSPVSVEKWINLKGDVYALVQGRRYFVLKKIGEDFSCEKQLKFQDIVLDVFPLRDKKIALSLWAGTQKYVREIDLAEQKFSACEKDVGHISPLLASQWQENLSFEEALAQSSLWQKEEDNRKNSLFLELGSEQMPTLAENEVEANYRVRPILTVPWIGADDALGPQFGLVSVPLMDELQNETLRVSLLYGPNSHYPNTELLLTSTRFKPTIDINVYRRQLYNGILLGHDRRYHSSYLDEKGMRVEASYAKNIRRFILSLESGVRASHIVYFLGPKSHTAQLGALFEPFASTALSFSNDIGNFSASWSIAGAPSELNTNFDYTKNAYAVGYSHSVFDKGLLALGLDYSYTRGKIGKTFNLKEYYQPLKTFTPGSGGGYNRNNYLLWGDGNLFQTRYGDTQARTKAAITYPLLRAIEKQYWLFYMERLNITAFYNYGGAFWQNDKVPHKKFTGAQGYNLDLLCENKGVHFSFTLGGGQVKGASPDLYGSFGFDAFF